MHLSNLWRKGVISPNFVQRGGKDFLPDTCGLLRPEGEGKVPETTGGTWPYQVPPLFLAELVLTCTWQHTKGTPRPLLTASFAPMRGRRIALPSKPLTRQRRQHKLFNTLAGEPGLVRFLPHCLWQNCSNLYLATSQRDTTTWSDPTASFAPMRGRRIALPSKPLTQSRRQHKLFNTLAGEPEPYQPVTTNTCISRGPCAP
jgi:hypothetical protein